jgi:hypothetical protein
MQSHERFCVGGRIETRTLRYGGMPLPSLPFLGMPSRSVGHADPAKPPSHIGDIRWSASALRSCLSRQR